ncbi:MAG TPA: UvrD-helicase domain-containing protein [Flavobacteriaceae bacterium]|nr:UvrD-helicase domain-containing protein [Flavobacteriaceae bacterium]
MKNPIPFVVYNASAGSGKTFALVKIYLSLLFTAKRNDAYRNILAITFTNKAVAEMKNRIVQNLMGFCQTEIPKKNRALLHAIIDETGLSEEDIRKKSKEILKSLVHNYAAFEVSTIDAFTNRVLRTFANDLGLSSNYDVELDVESILNEAVDRLVARAGEDQQLTKTLVDFAISKADDDRSWDISRDLYAVAKLLVNENHYAPLEKLKDKDLIHFRDFSKKLKTEMLRLEKEIEALCDGFFNFLEQNNLVQSDFSYGYLPKYFFKVQRKDFKTLFGAKWQESIYEKVLYPDRVSNDKKALLDNLHNQIADLFTKSKELILQHCFCGEIEKNLTQLSLLNSIQQEVVQIKEERNLILISDFNITIGASVKNQPVPFIYERLGERYRDYFIDEFQDTSQLQWENLIPLIDNALSFRDEKVRLGTLTIVGDAKQAIYRWRGGKAEQFMELGAGKSPFSTLPEPKVLGENYRSQQEIVDFNNGFFKHIAKYLNLETHRNLYENAAQNCIHKKAGYVNISFVEAKNKTEKEQIYPEKTWEIIRNLEANGYAKKDICILVRKQSQGIAIANFLNEKGVPIISSETLLIAKSEEVCFIVNLLASIKDAENKELKVAVLYFLWNFTAPAKEQHLFISEGLQFSGADFFHYLETFGFHFNTKKFQTLPLYDAVEYIVRCFGLVETSNAYMQFFLDFVYDYSQSSQGGIPGFLEHWETKKDKLSIVVPEGEDAVRIMTIHRAKGLEFPIVIYPFAEETLDDTRLDNCWISLEPPLNDIPMAFISANKKLMDYGENASTQFQELLSQKELDALNVLYVACTRPQQQLYVISEWVSAKKLNGKINTFSLLFIDYLNNLNRWDDSVLSYDFGEFLPNSISETNRQNGSDRMVNIEKFISTPPSMHNLNLATKSGSLWETKQENAIGFGETLHRILSYIHTTSDCENALKKAVFEELILFAETKFYADILEKITSHPQLQEYFAPGVKSFNEREIISEGMILRPDRIVAENEKAVIIDYKTGIPLPTHEIQIQRYAQAVENLGYTIAQKLLVYINNDVTLKIA